MDHCEESQAAIAASLVPVCYECGLEQLSINASKCHCCNSKLIQLVQIKKPSVTHIDLDQASENFKEVSKKERSGVFSRISILKGRKKAASKAV